MKLKPIVALTMLGFASTSLMAASDYSDDVTSRLDRLEGMISQNQSGVHADRMGWTDRIAISGDLRVNLTHSSRNLVLAENSKTDDINLADANFYIDARANDWAQGHVSVKFQQNGSFGLARDRNKSIQSTTDNSFFIDEAYMSLSNFSESDWYARIGRQYVDFGNYERNVVTQDVVHMFTQTRQTAITVGHSNLLGFFDIDGFHASVGAFRDYVKETGDATAAGSAPRELIRGWVGSLGYYRNVEGYDITLGAQYLHNLYHTDAMHFTRANATAGYYDEHNTRVGGFAANANLASGPWDVALRYATALSKFDKDVLATKTSDTDGRAKPWAASVTGTYKFDSWGGYPSSASVSYQTSGEAASYGADLTANGTNPIVRGMPKQRWLVDYTVQVWENTDFSLQYAWDQDYGTEYQLDNSGGNANDDYRASGRNASTITASLRFRFA